MTPDDEPSPVEASDRREQRCCRRRVGALIAAVATGGALIYVGVVAPEGEPESVGELNVDPGTAAMAERLESIA